MAAIPVSPAIMIAVLPPFTRISPKGTGEGVGGGRHGEAGEATGDDEEEVATAWHEESTPFIQENSHRSGAV